MILRWFVWLFLGASIAKASVTDREIASMFMLGFEGRSVSYHDRVMKDICRFGLGGVILFGKNIGTKTELKNLTSTLSSCAHKPLIAVDQEGGTVRRIRYGNDYPRAAYMASAGTQKATQIYAQMGRELHDLGINYNLAPVADLAVEPKNYIIYKLGRSYSKKPEIVKAYDSVFIKSMHKNHILTSLKHYPGHGSSLGDTHKGFVDVSKTWTPRELKPFANSRADSVMVAHVVNTKLTGDRKPASLSPAAITKLRSINHHTVVITDDLQMGAIRKYYTLKDTIRMAINAGDDILLFGNQLTRSGRVTTGQLIAIVRSLLSSHQIQEKSIKKALKRINRMRSKIKLPKISPHSKHHHRTKAQPNHTVTLDMY